MKDKFRTEIAAITAAVSKEVFSELAGIHPNLYLFDGEQLYGRWETPKDPAMGNYALPLFDLAKILRKNPAEISRKLVEEQNRFLREHPEYSHLSFSAAGGYCNARVTVESLGQYTLKTIGKLQNNYGSSESGKGQNIVIDFSSPNIAKPFGVGHLRSTAIGNSLYRIFRKLGYTPIGINHLGDWGTQFGKMIVAYRKWGSEKTLKDNPVESLYELYVRFHKEESNDPALAEAARDAFKAMENGDKDVIALWTEFRDLSMAAFNKTYDLLGVHFDYQTGESFYNDKMEAVIKRLERAGLTEISDGALIVPLEKYNLPACLLKKADGATLYATRDLTGILYRWENFHFAQALYVVASAQRIHFQQVFKVIELLEEAEKVPVDRSIASRLIHVEFGWIKFQDEVMSTRLGNIIVLEDVLEKARMLAKEKILEKNPDLKEVDKTSRQIGLGAVIFADLSSRKEKDVNFDWEKVLSFEGETGPYLQYTHARLSSLVRHYGRALPAEVNYSLLDKPEEYRVLDWLYRFPQVVEETASGYEPYLIGSYLLELASSFNKVYQRKDSAGRIDKIISDDIPLTDARMQLVDAVRVVIKEGLYLLGIEAPEEM